MSVLTQGKNCSVDDEQEISDVSSKLKIICFLFDPNTGGPTIRARAVYELMIQAGHQVRVAFPRGKGSAADYIGEKGIPVDKIAANKPVQPTKIVAFAKFAVSFPLALWHTTAYLKHQRPDVIHVNGAFDIGPALAGKFAGVPVVWHLNDTIFGEKLSRLLGKVVSRLATVVVGAAGRVAEHYGVDGPSTHIIYAPVNVDRFTKRCRDGHPRKDPVIGLLANWNPIKGQDRFIEVIARLKKERGSIKAQIIGRFLDSQITFWEPIVEHIRTSDLDDSIDCPGFVADTAGALTSLDILLLTSHSEACPICVLEAMSIGIPQVVFDVGGVREMLGEGDEAAGIIVAEGDIDAMVVAVERLLDLPDLYIKMAKNGQARARAHFSLEACVARHEAAYRAAVGRKRVG